MGFWSRLGAVLTDTGRPEEAVRIFVDRTRDEPTRRAQVEVVRTLSDRFGFETTDDPARLAAATESWAHLTRALADPASWVRATALTGLRELANILRNHVDPELVRATYGPVWRCLRDHDPQIRAEAGPTLSSFSDVMDARTRLAATRAVGALLADPDDDVRAQALFYLGTMDVEAREFLPGAYAALTDPDPQVRTSAVRAVKMIGPGRDGAPTEVIGRLMHLLVADPAPRVREGAADCLGDADVRGTGTLDRYVVTALIQALADPDAQVRHTVVFALGDLGAAAERAVWPLLQLADGEHREAVGFALRDIGTPAARQALRHAGLPLHTPFD
jgi:HEAT repeat protein